MSLRLIKCIYTITYYLVLLVLNLYKILVLVNILYGTCANHTNYIIHITFYTTIQKYISNYKNLLYHMVIINYSLFHTVYIYIKQIVIVHYESYTIQHYLFYRIIYSFLLVINFDLSSYYDTCLFCCSTIRFHVVITADIKYG